MWLGSDAGLLARIADLEISPPFRVKRWSRSLSHFLAAGPPASDMLVDSFTIGERGGSALPRGEDVGPEPYTTLMSGSFSCADTEPYAALLEISDDVLGPLVPDDRGGVAKSSRGMWVSTSADAVRLASLAADRNSSAWRRNLFRTIMKNKMSLFNTVFVRMVEQLKRAHWVPNWIFE